MNRKRSLKILAIGFALTVALVVAAATLAVSLLGLDVRFRAMRPRVIGDAGPVRTFPVSGLPRCLDNPAMSVIFD